MKRLIILTGLFLCLFPAIAQQLVTERVYRTTNSLLKSYSSSTLTRQGNVAFAATQRTASGSLYQSFVMLVKPGADTLWSSTGPLNSTSGVIAQTKGGKFALAATVRLPAPPTGAQGVEIAQFSTAGQPLGSSTYNFNNNDAARFLIPAPGGGFYVGGGGTVNGVSNNYVVTRTDSAGIVLWQQNYHKKSSTDMRDLRYTYTGNLVLTGMQGKANYDHLKVQVINQHGDSVLGRNIIVHDPTRTERPEHILPLTDGGYLITAHIDTTVGSSKSNLPMVVKLDASLQVSWYYIVRTFPVVTRIVNARELIDGSLLVQGHSSTQNNFAFKNNIYFYHFSATGALINTYIFTSALVNTPGSLLNLPTLEALADTTYMVGGSANGNKLYLAKIKLANLPLPLPLPPTPAAQPPVSTGIGAGYLALNAALGQSYPNPAQEQAIIPYNLPNSTRNAKILLTDITAREVGSYSLKVQQKQGRLPVDVSRLQNGLYLYSLVIDGKPVATKKLAVAR